MSVMNKVKIIFIQNKGKFTTNQTHDFMYGLMKGL